MAEEASRLKDEFLATLSHEIRTPLNAVIGWTRILQTQPSVRSRAHALEVIERNAMSQMRLVEDLLDMARIISGKLRLKIDAVSLDEVAQAAIDVVAPGAAAKQIAIETAFADEAAAGQRRRRAAPAGDLEPAVERAEVHRAPAARLRLEVAATAANVRLSVRDNGQGIVAGLSALRVRSLPPGRRVGEPAPRRPRARPVAGPANRRAARRHTSASESGGVKQGSTFWVSLPGVPDVGRRPPVSPIAAEPVTLNGVSILIVDDESDARELLVAMLENLRRDRPGGGVSRRGARDAERRRVRAGRDGV